MGTHMTPGNVYGCSKLQKIVSKSWYFLKFENGWEIFLNHELCLILYNEKMLTDRATVKS